MNQSERRAFLIKYLLSEDARYADSVVPDNEKEQKRLLRVLLNVRPPVPIDAEFLRVQDEYLRQETAAKGITDWHSLAPVRDGIYLWQGDITTLACGAIVNAANIGMTGCYYPCHDCIDNCIHTFAGVQLRLECNRLIEAQGHYESMGQAKITPAYNLPCDFVLHTVGPFVRRDVTDENKALLSSCYESCLSLADERNIESVAFCCISTGEFNFPRRLAAQIAIRTVGRYKEEKQSKIKVIFNVFGDEDYKIYRELLGAD